jgi:hypothetical protein
MEVEAPDRIVEVVYRWNPGYWGVAQEVELWEVGEVCRVVEEEEGDLFVKLKRRPCERYWYYLMAESKAGMPLKRVVEGDERWDYGIVDWRNQVQGEVRYLC